LAQGSRPAPGASAAAGRAAAAAAMAGAEDAKIGELQRQLHAEKERTRQLEEQFTYRVGALVQRESLAKKTVEALERKLGGPENAEEEHRQRMAMIRNMHDSVVGGLACLQANTAKILQDQEKDLMRAFRARLQDVSKELETHRSKKGDFSAELQARHRRVVAELHESQELAHIFDKKNQQLQHENAQLQEQLRRRVDDRANLVKDLVLTKREIARLKGALDKGQPRESQAPSGSVYVEEPSQEPRPKFGHHNSSYERGLKAREELRQAKRRLEEAKRVSSGWFQSQKHFLAERAELEVFLRQCIEDVERELARVQALEPNEDTPKVIEVLEAQHRVVYLVYGKAFPNRPPTPPRTPDVPEFADGFEEDLLKELDAEEGTKLPPI